MATSHHPVTFKGSPLTLVGREVKAGDHVPDFMLTANDMSDLSLQKMKGKVVIIASVPSLDTPVCSAETKKFNEEAAKLGQNAAVLTVSMDLPFAQKRWCAAEGATNVVTASDYKHRTFGEAFGVQLKEWGLLARAVFVVDKAGKIVYSQYVPEISSEPDYAPVLEAAKKAMG